MAKNQINIADLTIPQGERSSNGVDVRRGPGTIDVLTIFAPDLTGGEAYLELAFAPEGGYFPLMYKGSLVRIPSKSSVDIPPSAFKLMRVSTMQDQEEGRVFKVLALLDVD